MDIHLLHPMVVHFPITLWIIGTITLVLQAAGRPLERVTLWALGLGTLGGIAGVVTGNLAEDHAEEIWRVPERLLETHERHGYITTALFAAALIAVYLGRRADRRWLGFLAIVLAVLGCDALVLTGESGGDIVYKHALIRATASDQTTMSPPDAVPDHGQHRTGASDRD